MILCQKERQQFDKKFLKILIQLLMHFHFEVTEISHI